MQWVQERVSSDELVEEGGASKNQNKDDHCASHTKVKTRKSEHTLEQIGVYFYLLHYSEESIKIRVYINDKRQPEQYYKQRIRKEHNIAMIAEGLDHW